MSGISVRPLLVFSAVAAAVCLGAGACRTAYPTTTATTFTAVGRTPDLAHGKALLSSSCGGCHYDNNTGRYTGKRMEDLPGALGKVYASNLTASASHSPVPAYTDAGLAYLLRTGIKRDGHFVPFMLRPNMSDADLQDLIAFLRSGEGPVAAADTAAGVTRLSFIGKMGLSAIARPQPYRASVPHPATQLETGRYLVDNIGCFHCHSKKITAVNYLHPEESKGYLAGGAKFKKPAGTVRGSNITVDTATGIGYYSREDFRAAVQHMRAPGYRGLRPPMEPFDLTNEEVDAIYAYIHTLPPVRHGVKGQAKP